MVWLAEINSIKCVGRQHPFMWYFSQKYNQQVSFYWITLNLPLWSNPRLIKIHACFYNAKMWKELIFRFTDIDLKTLYNIQSCTFKLLYYVNVYVFKAINFRSPVQQATRLQRSPTFLGPWTSFVEDAFSRDWGEGLASGWFKCITFHLLCTLFLLLLHQLHLLWSGLRPQRLGTPRNIKYRSTL